MARVVSAKASASQPLRGIASSWHSGSVITSSLSDSVLKPLKQKLAAANQAMAKVYPGESGVRQPVHTVYGGANLFNADLAAKLGSLAIRAFDAYGNDPEKFAVAVGLSARGDRAKQIHSRVHEKLKREPIEDFRIDFEDGYGIRPDEEEDADAVRAALEVAKGHRAKTLPPFLGIRIKPLSDELFARSMRTVDVFYTALVGELGEVPNNFVVTLPKITSKEQVTICCETLGALEEALSLAHNSLKIEFMIEMTQTIYGPDGSTNLPLFLDAAKGRCVGAHFGTYDYTACCNVTAEQQRMQHPVCDFAKHMMQVAYANRGLWLSDGATNIMPVPIHRVPKGESLSPDQIKENQASVDAAWALHSSDIRHSLTHGYYQGWDLHPAQLVTRYATVYDFFLEGFDAATERLTNFIGKAAQATLVGDVFDDAATGQGLLNFFLRGINCGAFEESAALATGITLDELRGRSFVKILDNRRGG